MKIALLVLCLSGCAGVDFDSPIAPTSAAGNYLTTMHGTMRYMDALQGAQQYCGRRGLGVRGMGTDSPPNSLAISRFECVPR